MQRTPRSFEPADAQATRPTWAELDLTALATNLRTVRRLAGRRRIIAVVKANAYGHGAKCVAATLVRLGVEALAVATLEEARELRGAGLALPILLLEGLHRAQDADEVLARGLIPVISRLDWLDVLEAAAKRAGRSAAVHFKFDTGMSRLGFDVHDLEAVIARMRSSEALECTGLMTHLAEADDPKSPATARQRESFEGIVARVRDAGFDPTWIHADPSAGLYRGLTDCATAVRPGIMLYGADPTLERCASLEPVMSLFSRVVQVRDVPAGTRVGYGGSFVTPRATRLLTLPVGYADGLPRAAGGKVRVAIAGAGFARLVGRVSMDLAVVDAGPGVHAPPGTEVMLFGRRGDVRLPAEDLAEAVGTISYEIFTGIGSRVPRLDGRHR